MGTIRKRPNGKRQAIVRVKGHEHIYKTFDSHKEAMAWIRETEKQLESKLLTSPDILIGELIDRYVREIYPKRKRMADSHLKHDIPSIKRSFGKLSMRDLVGNGLQKWVLDQSTSSGTRNWHIARLFGVLRQAEMHWSIHIPWDDMKRCRDRLWEEGYIAVADERSRRLSDDELNAIKKVLNHNGTVPMADVIDFCVASAMRISEVCRIEWADLNAEARTVIIRDRKHPRKKFGNHQEVPLLNGAYEVIERQARKKERIFPYCKVYLSKLFKRACDKAGVEDAVLHDLRHEGISRLFELGFEIQEVAMVSGHTNWRTLRRYTHLRPASLVEKERRLRLLAA